MESELTNLPQLVELSQMLFALANVKRLSIIRNLKDHEMNVGTLAERVDLSQSALSQHLVRLKELGIVEARREKQMRFYSLTNNALTAALLPFFSQPIQKATNGGKG